MSQDEGMINAYKDNKDLYSTIAQGVYHNSYEDNLEHYPDGSLNPEGKKRRNNCKQVLLGISYGLGIFNLAEKMNVTIDEAKTIMEDFYKAFPKVRDWQESTKQFARDYGYVEDIWGRKRRLPNMQLPRFELLDNTSIKDEFNPILGCSNRTIESDRVKKFSDMLKKNKGKKDILDTIQRASKEGITIIDNSSRLVHAENQCVNARIQGSAATMTKMAMNRIYRDPEMNSYGFRLLIGVHDELIGECPSEYAEKASERLSFLMKSVVADVIDVPFKSDSEISSHWYYDDYSSIIKEEYEDLLKMGLKEDAKYQIYKDHSELAHEQLDEILSN